MITRRKDYAKREPSRDAGKIYIVCEGADTEVSYFSFFQGLSSNLELILIPPQTGTDPLKLMELAKEKLLSEIRDYTLDYRQNDKVWFAIDTDSWEEKGKILPLRKFCNTLNMMIPEQYSEVKAYEAWNVAQSNPCFEIWLYYHHYDLAPEVDEIQHFASFKAFVDSQIAGGFDFQKDQVRLKEAITNSERNFKKQSNGNPEIFSTEQFLLGKEIMKFVRAELQKIGNKLG